MKLWAVFLPCFRLISKDLQIYDMNYIYIYDMYCV